MQCTCSAAVINWGLLVLILYALYYTALEPAAGLSWGVLLGVPMWLTATAFCQHVPHAWAWALGLHILSWFLQVRLYHALSAVCRGQPDDAWRAAEQLQLCSTRSGLTEMYPRQQLHAVLTDCLIRLLTGLMRWDRMQVEVGHIMIEHRKPALLDSFFQVGPAANSAAWACWKGMIGCVTILPAHQLDRPCDRLARADSPALLAD